MSAIAIVVDVCKLGIATFRRRYYRLSRIAHNADCRKAARTEKICSAFRLDETVSPLCKSAPSIKFRQGSTMGFEYLQDRPLERFRIPDHSNPIAACSALPALTAYPHITQLKQRQAATDAFQAWILRAAIEYGIKIKPPSRLTRKQLPPALMRRRVYPASKRIEFEAVDLVQLGMDMTFFRSGGPIEMARLLGGYFRAKGASVQTERNIDKDSPFLRDHLKYRRAKAALDNADTLKDFRRRVWKMYFPTLPLAAAIHVDCLKFDFHKRDYGVKVPEYGVVYQFAGELFSTVPVWIRIKAQSQLGLSHSTTIN